MVVEFLEDENSEIERIFEDEAISSSSTMITAKNGAGYLLDSGGKL